MIIFHQLIVITEKGITMEKIIQEMILTIAKKIDILLIGKSIMELILFIIFLKAINQILTVFFNKIISNIHDTETKKHYQTFKQLGTYIINAVIILFFATNILGNFGIDMKPILATAGVLGVAVGFGAKKFVEDLLTGLSIILTGQLRVGDFVTVNNSTGTVEKVMLTMIVIRAFNGDVHYLRNGQIDTVINQTKKFSYPLFRIGVAYKTDINKVLEVLKDLGKEIRENHEFSKAILSDIEVCGLDSFKDSSLEILARIKTKPQEQWRVRRKFNQMIKERFEKEGIEIPFPQVVITEAEEHKHELEQIKK